MSKLSKKDKDKQIKELQKQVKELKRYLKVGNINIKILKIGLRIMVLSNQCPEKAIHEMMVCMEGFFGILKREMFYSFEKDFKDIEELEITSTTTKDSKA